jgi:diaminopimelate epimerase
MMGPSCVMGLAAGHPSRDIRRVIPERAMDFLPFRKMHGIGNDFVVVDARAQSLSIGPELARRIADRHRGVGFDQLLVLEPARSPDADIFMRILNADGSESGACGNGTRCVAALLMDETGRAAVAVETRNGVLACQRAGDLVSVDMGRARMRWSDVPLAREEDTLHLPIRAGALSDAVGLSMGNPHAVFFVPDAEAVDLDRLGPIVENDPLFPQRTNVEVAQVLDRGRIRLRVWERGVGVTLACGSGACATAVAAARRGLTDRQVAIDLDGGRLTLDWRENGSVIMTGPAATSFEGRFPLAA